MFHILIAILRSIILIVNLLVLPTVVVVLGLIRLLPVPPLKRLLTYIIYEIIVPVWLSINTFAVLYGNKATLNLSQKGELDKNGWYFVISNHVSWADILILTGIFNRKIPMIKFFMKKELLWSLPIVGVAAWLVDFPVMQRHSKEYLKKHPEQRGKDIETTRKKCEIFKHQPVSIINFLEGTRFTEAKKRQRNSAFHHLLPPKAGGLAFTLAALKEVMHDIIDVTLCYQPNGQSLWDLLCNRVDRIDVHIEVIPIPSTLRGDYYNDREFKIGFNQWLHDRWLLKDAIIEAMLKDQKA
ncbi:MAG: 1-acyl-sn-glycerol-3-phosphate acyltransferase [Coxiellaceae bacterium]|nr:1-acyl-sn-glycerol-3-phosphate acyltransferase [Coxiellaceae bacterium]